MCSAIIRVVYRSWLAFQVLWHKYRTLQLNWDEEILSFIAVAKFREVIWMPVYYFILLLPTGFAAIIAQFHINHFRSVAWYNVVIGIGYIFLQLAMFRGESKCDCQNTCRKSNCSLPKKSKFKEMMTWSNVFLIMVFLKWPKVSSLIPSPSAWEWDQGLNFAFRKNA